MGLALKLEEYLIIVRYWDRAYSKYSFVQNPSLTSRVVVYTFSKGCPKI